MSPLAQLLRRHGLRQSDLAAGLGLAPSTVTHWLRHGRRPEIATRERVEQWLVAQGVPAMEAERWDAPESAAAGPASPARGESPDDDASEDIPMLLNSTPLRKDVQRHFGLSCDPFARDLQSHDEVFSSPDIAYVREALWSTARHGGLLAIVGESGSGKTTLLEDLEDRIARDNAPVVLIRPDVTGMEATDTRGRVVRVRDIQEAVISGLTPDVALRQSPEGRAAQLRAALIAARQSGKAVCLAFDEAHAMPIPTLRHLKRLMEIKQGFQRLISIILLGQTELGIRLSARTPEVREVVQRVEVVTLDPLDDQLRAYLDHRLRLAGRRLDELADPAALDALAERLGIGERGGQVSRAYPLAAGNLIAAALVLAHAAGAPRLTAGAVRGVRA